MKAKWLGSAAALAAVLGLCTAARAACLVPPGDLDGNGTTNVVDVQCSVITVLWQLGGGIGAPPACAGGSLEQVDSNCDGVMSVADAQLTIAYVLGASLGALDQNGNNCPDQCDIPPDADGDGSPDAADCAPNNNAIFPGAPELCNGLDDNCNAIIDEGGAALCEDGDLCTTNSCQPTALSACCSTTGPAGCADNLACQNCICDVDPFCCENSWDSICVNQANNPQICQAACGCASAQCVSAPVECNSDDSCSVASCDPAIGCVLQPACDDADPCTEDSCIPSTPGPSVCCSQTGGPGCADNQACQDCVCAVDPFCCASAWDGLCVNQAADAGLCRTACACDSQATPLVCSSTPKDCNDNNACTDDSCDGVTGACTSIAVSCDDGNPCTTESCDPLNGCVTVPACDDNDPCTIDACKPGNSASACCGQVSGPGCPDSQACEDCVCAIDPFCCNTSWDSICVNEANAPELCQSACGCVELDPGAGVQCAFTPNSCDDGNACTIDACDPAAGGCAYTAVTCDDGNPCTDEVCDPAQGCMAMLTAQCNDNNPCTEDTCAPNLVTGPSLCCTQTGGPGCADNGNCESCVCGADPFCCQNSWDSLCVQRAASPSSCRAACNCDGINAPFTCGNTPKDCSDGNQCTTDACDPATGDCQNPPTTCDDGNTCTTESCDPATGCAIAPLCNDNNACTTDTCLPTGGPVSSCCSQTGSAGCADNAACQNCVCSFDPFCCNNSWDSLCVSEANDPQFCRDECGCAGGPVCVFSDITSCDDGNACTTDFCDSVLGCQHILVNCDDFNACTVDVCSPTQGCSHPDVVCEDFNACTENSCDPQLGCLYDLLVCNDANACTIDSCSPLNGCMFQPVDCSDSNQCTIDSCNAVTGCGYAPVVCNDFNACTSDSCDPVAGCVSSPINCDDGNPCTTESCDIFSGCSSVPACNDSNACTQDLCTSGVAPSACCSNTGVAGCADNSACQNCVCAFDPFCCNNSWDSLCVSEANDPQFCRAACNCDGGAGFACTFSPVSCDDGNVCTTESCAPATGCTSTPLNCDDGNGCTTDTCDPLGGCQSSAPCDDSDPCTTGTCVTTSGASACCTQTGGPGCADNAACASCVCAFDSFCCNNAWDSICVGEAADPNLCAAACGCGTQASQQCQFAAVNCDDGNACTADACSAGDVCPGGTAFGGKCLKAFAQAVNFSAAAAACQGAGGNLVSVTSPEKQAAALSAMNLACGAGFDAWIGLTDQAAEGQFQWLTGEPVAYTNWSFGEPNNAGDEDAVHMFANGFWNDLPLTALQGCFVCELPVVQAGSCSHVPLVCNDGSPCTDDFCDPAVGCTTESACADGNACTEDVCSVIQPSACCTQTSGPGCADSAACQACVCSFDGFCCNTSWDSLCVQGANNTCGAQCQCGLTPGIACSNPPKNCNDGNACTQDSCVNNPASSCCSNTGSAGCADSTTCAACVCAADPFCCNNSWDSLCVGGAQNQCNGPCGCSNPSGAPGCFNTPIPGCF